MQIEQTLIDEIIRKNDIAEVIGKSLKLKRSGGNYFACCPFHNEKSASFSVNINKQFFHCFGCGESGNVITFVMKYNGLSFVDAIKSLAGSAGVYIPENKVTISKEQIAQQKEHKLNLEGTINQVVNYYQNNLTNSDIASNYLAKRGLPKTIVDQFILGYVPNTPNPLSGLFKDYATNKFLIDAGLVVKNEAGKIYDRFRDRIMFPIRNVRGNIIGFGGRIIDKGEPKYLNSPETELFNKSLELYGLFEAQKQIRDKNQAFVVEGYMDVIAMFQFGIDNVVASMGTAATDEQIKKLFRLCDDIYFCFDGDKAGQKAAWRALTRSIPLVTDAKAVHFIFLPTDHDPDSFLRKHGTSEFIKYQNEHCLSMSDFLLKQLALGINTSSNEGRAKLISLAKPFIEQVNAVALQVMLKKQLASLVGLDATVLESILNNRSRYAFYTQRLKPKLLPEISRVPLINKILIIIQTAIKNVGWVINYKLPEPEELEGLSREVLDLIILLDYIQNNYDDGDTVELQNIECESLNLNNLKTKSDELVDTNEKDFIKRLDILLKRTRHRVTRIPNIPMKSN